GLWQAVRGHDKVSRPIRVCFEMFFITSVLCRAAAEETGIVLPTVAPEVEDLPPDRLRAQREIERSAQRGQRCRVRQARGIDAEHLGPIERFEHEKAEPPAVG